MQQSKHRPFTTATLRLAAESKGSHYAPEGHAVSTPETRQAQQALRGQRTKSSPTDAIAKRLRRTDRDTTETYVAYSVTSTQVAECAAQADYKVPQAGSKTEEVPKTAAGEDLGVGTGWWYEHLQLTPTFNTWAQVTFLHMYALTVRFRMFPPEHAPTWHQHLLDHFFFRAEEKMVLFHGMAAKSVRDRYLKDLYVQWRGLIVAYDEGLVKGDAVLGGAVWRNIFQAREDVDLTRVAEVVAYLRQLVQQLDRLTEKEICTADGVSFQQPTTKTGLEALVASQSRGVTEALK